MLGLLKAADLPLPVLARALERGPPGADPGPGGRRGEADVAESFGDELPGGLTARYATTMDDVLEVVLPDVVGVAP